MAIIKHGKIHGKIGNYIYRVINGKEIIQSYPRRTRQANKPKPDNNRFGDCSRVNSKIYRIIKDFALSAIDGKFYGELMAMIKENFFCEYPITHDKEYREWNMVPQIKFWAINKRLRLQRTLALCPSAELSEGICKVTVPASGFKSSNNRYLRDSYYVKYAIALVHYDFESDVARLVYEFSSERMLMSKGIPAEEFEIALESLNTPVAKGLLFVCFGLRFYATGDGFGYLNSKDFNPCGMLGAWYKG